MDYRCIPARNARCEIPAPHDKTNHHVISVAAVNREAILPTERREFVIARLCRRGDNNAVD